MGTVNYFTSDYITLGLKPCDPLEMKKDFEFMEEMRQKCENYGGTIEDAINDYIKICYECDLCNVETELNKHSFYYYNISIKPGYYEGFTIDIENNFPIAFDNWEDRKAASKEITEIKKFLITCAGFGLVECSPGWCTGYNDYGGTIKSIKTAVKEMRDEIKTIPTWKQYLKNS